MVNMMMHPQTSRTGRLWWFKANTEPTSESCTCSLHPPPPQLAHTMWSLSQQPVATVIKQQQHHSGTQIIGRGYECQYLLQLISMSGHELWSVMYVKSKVEPCSVWNIRATRLRLVSSHRDKRVVPPTAAGGLSS